MEDHENSDVPAQAVNNNEPLIKPLIVITLFLNNKLNIKHLFITFFYLIFWSNYLAQLCKNHCAIVYKQVDIIPKRNWIIKNIKINGKDSW
ncbi:hypothetical protein [Xenorhabdus cabanillasii]|uniref:hypothetical protein n=1 Tax=Xenorhabdus cabanillasii TaxID=351673 RepID=UPI0004B41CFC|nr:hypothetical protein [Xenorhabdus cabanillasii]